MKKIYSFLVAAVLASFAASAINVNPAPFNGSKLELKERVERYADMNTMRKAPAKNAVESLNDLCGVYVATYADYSVDPPTVSSSDVIIKAGAAENQVLITGIAGMPLPVVATVDIAASTLFIEPQILEGNVTTADDPTMLLTLQLTHGIWNEDGNGYTESDEPFFAEIVDGSIYFSSDDLFFFNALNENATTHLGVVAIIDTLTLVPLGSGEDYVFEYVGVAKFQDGWIVPGSGVDSSEYVFEVDFGQSVENPNKLARLDPYSNEIFSESNMSTTPGKIVFDITDPDCVIVHIGYNSGFNDGTEDFYCYNYEGYLLDQAIASGQEVTTEDVKAAFAANNITCSTYKNGVVTIPTCMFGVTSQPNGGFGWQDQYGNPIQMEAKIYLPEDFVAGVKDVEINNVSTVEYFNLQGIKVEKPESGLYIRRNGKNVEKIYIK